MTYSKSVYVGRFENEKDQAAAEEKFVKIQTKLTQRYEKAKQQKELMEGGAVIAINIACALPWGRGLAVGLKLLKFGCMAGFGVPLNTYFLFDATMEHQKTLSNVFSSVEFKQPFYEHGLEDTSSSSLGIYLGVALFPLGMEIKNVKVTSTLIKDLLKKRR